MATTLTGATPAAWDGGGLVRVEFSRFLASRREYRTGMVRAVTTERQIAVRLRTEQLEALDDLVRRGVYGSRAAAVRAGIDALVEVDRRRRDDRSIVDGYTRTPPTGTDIEAAIASMRDAIAEEPW